MYSQEEIDKNFANWDYEEMTKVNIEYIEAKNSGKINVLYIHGFEGSGNGPSSQMLQKVLGDEYHIMAPQFDLLDFESTQEKIKWLLDCTEYIVSSSFGCFYSMMAKAKYKILINPAFPNDLIRNSLVDNVDELSKKLRDFLEKNLSLEDREKTYFAFGLQDKLVDNKEWVKKHYSNERIFTCEMGHKLNKKGAKVVADIINCVRCGSNERKKDYAKQNDI